MSLGGTCVSNPKGWEVGTYEVELSSTGRLIFGQDVLVRRYVHMLHESGGSEGKGIIANSRVPQRSCASVATSIRTTGVDTKVRCARDGPPI